MNDIVRNWFYWRPVGSSVYLPTNRLFGSYINEHGEGI